MIRHKATGEFMPELKRTRGYSHWNPSKVDTREAFSDKKKLLGVPRLFSSRKKAHGAIVQWNAMPNARWSSQQSYYGDYDEAIDFKADGRTKNDLEIVEVNIEEVKCLEQA